jgi:hypothetical protein
VRRKNEGSVLKKHLGYIFALTLTISVSGSGSAGAMSVSMWHDLLTLLPDLKEMFDAAPGLVANDLPSLVSVNGDLQERLKRAEKFHSTHEFKETEPKIDGARLFSKEPGVSAAMRDEYAGFVEREARDIKKLKVSRDAQDGHLADYQRILDRNIDFENKAPDLIGRAAMAGTAGEQMAQELAAILLTTSDAISQSEKLVKEYQRILAEYDGKIQAEEANYAGHAKTLEIVDAIRPKPESAGPGASVTPPPASGKSDVAARTGGATLKDRIGGAVSGATADVDAHASQSQTQLWLEQRRMGPIRPPPSQQGSSGPSQQQAPPDFSATMTPVVPAK